MARLRSVPAFPYLCILILSTCMFLPGCGGNYGGGGGGGGQPPATPSGLTATAGNAQVNLSWSASSGATSYNVKRSTTSGGPYTTIASPTTTSYNDPSLTNGTAYYYVLSAVNPYGESGNSSQASATPAAPANSVQVTIDTLANRHAISKYVYGGAFPSNAAAITDTGTTVVRWGGNGASTYNWELGTSNADNDYYFEDFAFGALNNPADSDSASFIKDVKAAGSVPLMTMVMLPWVAQSPETSTQQGTGSDNLHWTFPSSEYPNQCSFDQYNLHAGNGIVAGTCNNNPPSYITATQADLQRTYFPLFDAPSAGDPTGSVYRNQWVTDPTKGLAQAFGSGTCSIPYTAITSCHFYDMDNEIDIWGGTHRDVHPSPTTFQELRDIYLKESAGLKGWDPAAVRLGPVSCCWYFYWRSATGAGDTSSHGGVDFLPWWLNEVAWSDAVSGSRTLDMFDIHAYPDADTNGLSQTQQRALAVKIYRDWWDPTFNSAAQYIVNGGFSIEPLDGKPFRIPRMRALVNQIYPGTGFAMTEWSAEFAGSSDFSTALGDADAYGVLGRERVSLSTRWTAPSSTNPNYQALKLYTNYDGGHHGFGTTSVSATHDADPSLFSTYAALNSAGTVLTIMVLNKDPANGAQVVFTTNGFTPTNFTTYTLSQTSPTAIVAGTSQSWSATQTFAPYTATLLVVNGSSVPSAPSVEWDLNPDTIMVPASGTAILKPAITGGSSTVTLTNAVFDAYEGAAACAGGSIVLTTANITNTVNGVITVNAGGTPGFCHFTVTGTDGIVTQTQGGWIVVGKPAATLAKTTGDGQTGPKGSPLPVPITVTLMPGQSGGTATGASVLFTTSAGSLSDRTNSGSRIIVVTNNSGVTPGIILTLPTTAEPVTVTAEGPYGLGHPVATFNETSQ
jgi:glycosyl hydrolase family 44